MARAARSRYLGRPSPPASTCRTVALVPGVSGVSGCQECQVTGAGVCGRGAKGAQVLVSRPGPKGLESRGYQAPGAPARHAGDTGSRGSPGFWPSRFLQVTFCLTCALGLWVEPPLLPSPHLLPSLPTPSHSSSPSPTPISQAEFLHDWLQLLTPLPLPGSHPPLHLTPI